MLLELPMLDFCLPQWCVVFLRLVCTGDNILKKWQQWPLNCRTIDLIYPEVLMKCSVVMARAMWSHGVKCHHLLPGCSTQKYTDASMSAQCLQVLLFVLKLWGTEHMISRNMTAWHLTCGLVGNIGWSAGGILVVGPRWQHWMLSCQFYDKWVLWIWTLFHVYNYPYYS